MCRERHLYGREPCAALAQDHTNGARDTHIVSARVKKAATANCEQGFKFRQNVYFFIGTNLFIMMFYSIL